MVFELLYTFENHSRYNSFYTQILMMKRDWVKKRDSIMMRSPVARFVSPLGDPCQMYGK